MIPIVLAFGSDPVKLGLVASLNRPGGNVTGVSFISTELVGKRLELLAELVPQAGTVAYLRTDRQNSSAVTEQMTSDIRAAARALGRQIFVLEVGNTPDLEAAFATLIDRRVGALVVAAHTIFDTYRGKLAALAARHKIPAIYQFRDFVTAGG